MDTNPTMLLENNLELNLKCAYTEWERRRHANELNIRVQTWNSDISPSLTASRSLWLWVLSRLRGSTPSSVLSWCSRSPFGTWSSSSSPSSRSSPTLNGAPIFPKTELITDWNLPSMWDPPYARRKNISVFVVGFAKPFDWECARRLRTRRLARITSRLHI